VFLGNSAAGPCSRGSGAATAAASPCSRGAALIGTGFAAELRASHPQGTGRVKAQLQAVRRRPVRKRQLRDALDTELDRRERRAPEV
jgi:hypothetical protein